MEYWCKVRAQLRRIQLRRNVGIASLASQYLPARRSRSTTGLHKVRSKTPNCMIELWCIYMPYLTRLLFCWYRKRRRCCDWKRESLSNSVIHFISVPKWTELIGCGLFSAGMLWGTPQTHHHSFLGKPITRFRRSSLIELMNAQSILAYKWKRNEILVITKFLGPTIIFPSHYHR